MDIFEMIDNTYELTKELVNKELLIFKWYKWMWKILKHHLNLVLRKFVKNPLTTI
jgi:hypothetical protein